MSDVITVSCPECETKLRLKDRRAVGKRIKCPKCEVPFLVEVPSNAVEDDPLDFLDDFDAAPSSRSRSRNDDALDDDVPAKSKKKKSSSNKKKKRRKSSVDWQQPVMIGGGILLLLLLLGGGAYLFTGTSSASNRVDLSYLPADMDTLVKINVAEIAQAPILSPMMQHEKVKEGLDEFSKTLGIDLADVESITMGVRSDDGGVNNGFPGMPTGMGGMNSLIGSGASNFTNGIGVVRLTRTIDPQSLINADDQQATLMRHNGRSLLRRPVSPGQTEMIAALFATDTLVIIGPEETVKSAYDAGPVQVRRPEFDFINPDMQLLFATVPRDRQVFKNQAATAPLPDGVDKNILEFTIGMGGGIDFNSDVDLEIWYSLESRSAASSAQRGLEAERKQAHDQITQLKTMLNEQSAMLAMMAPNIKPSAEKLISIAEQTIDSMSGSKSGSYYTMEMTIPGSIGPTIQELVANMPDMSGMGGLSGMGLPSSTPSGPGAGYPAGAGAAGAFPGSAGTGQMPAGVPGVPGAAGTNPAQVPGGFPGPAGAMPPGPAGAIPPGAAGVPPGVPGASPAAVPPGPAGAIPGQPGGVPAGAGAVPPGPAGVPGATPAALPAGAAPPGAAGAIPPNVPAK
ncbi:MAG: hypothetical protein O2955_12840 [Planctomycetota bacterium]|nr:hypothetical protein [Planctomycetota bacterium]MDA1213395.1 hypothetical protein [Planctomycetota bacterium]